MCRLRRVAFIRRLGSVGLAGCANTACVGFHQHKIALLARAVATGTGEARVAHPQACIKRRVRGGGGGQTNPTAIEYRNLNFGADGSGIRSGSGGVCVHVFFSYTRGAFVRVQLKAGLGYEKQASIAS